MIFFIIHKQIFQDFSIFLYIFWFCIDIFFLWNLYSKINQGKRSKIFFKYLFSSNYDLVLISFFLFLVLFLMFTAFFLGLIFE
jgi:hypothetical protein